MAIFVSQQSFQKFLLALTLFAVIISVPGVHGHSDEEHAVTFCGSGLSSRYYSRTCPKFSSIVTEVVKNYTALDVLIPARLIRLLFHDCAVQGCDASVMLLTANNITSERDAQDNEMFVGMRGGYPTVFAIKERLEAACPGIVSCADILAAAAATGLVLAKGPRVTMRYGRRDSLTSFKEGTDLSLPHQWYAPSKAKATFARMGITTKQMVALMGSHTMGTANCWKFYARLGATVDPRYDPAFGQWLNTTCVAPVNGTGGKWPWVALDNTTRNVFDNQYYKNLLVNKGLLNTDHGLVEDPATLKYVNAFAKSQKTWFAEYSKAFKKMSELNVLVGYQGEVRRDCEMINDGTYWTPEPAL